MAQAMLSAAGFEVDRADELVTTAHDAGYGLIPLTLPGLDRVGLVPRFIQLPILLGQAQVVAFAHVEVGACNHAANRRPGHDLLGFEVDLGQA